MKILIALSVILNRVTALFRSSSYSYTDGAYASSSDHYVSSSYYTTSYRSPSTYSSNEIQKFTYMDGSTHPTVSQDDITRGVQSQANSASVIDTSSSFSTGKLRYYFGTQYMPSQQCEGSSRMRKKREVSFPSKSTTTQTKNSSENTVTTVPFTVDLNQVASLLGTNSSTNLTDLMNAVPSSNSTTLKNSGVTSTTVTKLPGTADISSVTVAIDQAASLTSTNTSGNFTEMKDTLSYMNMFYVNFSDPVESLNYVETYLPDNFTSTNSTNVIESAVASLPIETTSYTDLAETLLDTSETGSVNDSVSDWYKDLKDEETYNTMIVETNSSGPVQTYVGCTENSAYAICTRSIADLGTSINKYTFTPSSPTEIAWQCPDKDQFCCEWECCKEKKWHVIGLIFCILLCILALSCCFCLCAICEKKKEKERETTVIAMYPKPQNQAYFISVPPRTYY